MSATHSWLTAIGRRWRARFGQTAQLCRESVVAGLNSGFLRHSRLSSRRILATRLWLTSQPSRFSRAVIRR